MIEESYVSFDTAKMLKEAGFDVPCRDFFTIEGDGNVVITEARSCRDHNSFEDCFISRPTQALAARWLREKHRIVVDVTFIPPSVDGNEWQYFIGEMDDIVWKGDFESSARKYSTYEEALEAGLKEAIKLIKK